MRPPGLHMRQEAGERLRGERSGTGSRLLAGEQQPEVGSDPIGQLAMLDIQA